MRARHCLSAISLRAVTSPAPRCMGSLQPSQLRQASMTAAPSNGSTKLSPVEVNLRKARELARDFRTDTITAPTDEMFDVMKEATRGDDVMHEDDATSSFEAKMAKLAGKEAGMFVMSGTMGNQLALRTHLQQPPHSILVDARAHIHVYEAGGAAFHSQANTIAVWPENGHHLTLEDVEDHIVLGDDIHSAPTRIVALENTLNGTVNPQEEIVRISKAMRKQGVIMHCDGARMWEVAAKTGRPLHELCEPFDSVSLCMSKGLGAPIGSVLVGSRALIEKAKWFRKLFGGGVRQCGSLAAAANFAFENHFPQLPRTHRLATKLAVALADEGVRLCCPVETNMVWIDTQPLGFSLQKLTKHAKETNGLTLGGTRVVVHVQTDPAAIDDIITAVRELKVPSAKQAKPDSFDREENARYARGQWTKPIARPRRVRIYEQNADE